MYRTSRRTGRFLDGDRVRKLREVWCESNMELLREVDRRYRDAFCPRIVAQALGLG